MKRLRLLAGLALWTAAWGVLAPGAGCSRQPAGDSPPPETAAADAARQTPPPVEPPLRFDDPFAAADREGAPPVDGDRFSQFADPDRRSQFTGPDAAPWDAPPLDPPAGADLDAAPPPHDPLTDPLLPRREGPDEVHLPHDETAAADRGIAAADLPAAGHEEYFAGWPRPRTTLVITGRQDGYLEPCGCTGLKNQKGGLNRKFTLVAQLRRQGWNPVGLDAGNQVRRFGRQQELKFHATIEGLRQMGYAAIGLGPNDLQLSIDELIAAVAPRGDQPTPFLSANVNLLDLTPRYRVIESGGVKIGVTAVLGDEARRGIVSGDLMALHGAEEALRQVWPRLEAERCDLYVLLAWASIDEAARLAAAVPGFQVVVTTGGSGEPPHQPDRVNDGRTWLVQVGEKGMFVSVIGLFDDPQQPLRYQRVALDARFEDAREMLELLAAYQQQLETLGLEGLGLRPVPHPTGLKFAGSASCGECHTIAYDIWKETPHAHALQTLVTPPERYEVPRHHDPECIACHVVGWDPKNYVPYRSGYLNLESPQTLYGVGCESCHGPGATHVAAERGEIAATEEELHAYRRQVRLPLARAENVCKDCHDLDNSPDFHLPGAFRQYWEKVKHKGME